MKNPKMELIGKGIFTKAYRCSITKRVFLKSKCMIKECMANGWFPKSALFPKVERSAREGYDYVMKDYSDDKYKIRVKDLIPSHKRLYHALASVDNFPLSDSQPGYQHLYSEVSKLDILPQHKQILLAALGACSNYGEDVMLDFCKRNLRQSVGKLILLDCFVIQSQAMEIRNKKKKNFR